MHKPRTGLAERSIECEGAGHGGMRDGRMRMRLAAACAGLACLALASAPVGAIAASPQTAHHRQHAKAAGHHRHRAKAGRHKHRKARLTNTYVREEAHLHLARKLGGSSIVEKGSGHGTFQASIQIRLTIKTRVTGALVAHLPGGTIYGHAVATPHFSGKFASFKGTLKITKGTGRYAHAKGTAGFYGSINRYNYELNVQVIGKLLL